jgi:hypothetical protein
MAHIAMVFLKNVILKGERLISREPKSIDKLNNKYPITLTNNKTGKVIAYKGYFPVADNYSAKNLIFKVQFQDGTEKDVPASEFKS